MQFGAVFVVGVADGEARHVIYNDAAVERVELEEPILPLFLLLARVMCEEAVELGDGCGVLRGGHGRQARGGSHGRGHGGGDASRVNGGQRGGRW